MKCRRSFEICLFALRIFFGISIRDLCVFAQHDLIRDPPFSRLDLISCRNVLIYLDQTLHRRILSAFHYALKPHGFLVLGPSETVGQSAEFFEYLGGHHRMYARKDVSERAVLALDTGESLTRQHAGISPSTGLSGQFDLDRMLKEIRPPAIHALRAGLRAGG
jgi:hypothetical protein